MFNKEQREKDREERIQNAEERLEEVLKKTKTEVFFAWLTDEFHYHDRGMWWYIIASFITVLLLVYAFIDENFLFAIIVVLGAAAIFLGHKKGPDVVSVIFTDEGLYYNEKLIPYPTMKSFYIIYEPPYVKDLYVEFYGLRSRLRLGLEEIDPVSLRAFLIDIVKEDREKDDIPFSEAFARIFKI